jgi:hypothetical protein
LIQIDYADIPDFSYLLQELQNPTNTLRAFASYRASQFAQMMGLQQDYDGSPTAPLSDRYRIEKERAVGRKVIRSRTGKLRESHRVYVQGDRVIEEIRAPYAVHVSAKRPILPGDEGLNARDQAKLLDLAITAIQRQIRAVRR